MENLNELETIIEETIKNSKNGSSLKIQENLEKCLKIVKCAKTQETGILSGFRLNGKIALVTGGASGIGKGVCHALIEAGCKVAVCDKNYPDAIKVSEDIKEKGGNSIAVEVDVANEESVNKMVDQIVSHWGRLDIAVNNAGIFRMGPAENATSDDWNAIINTNLRGVFFCSQAEGRQFLKQGDGGKIINTTSVCATIVNNPWISAIYNTSKAGVLHMTKSLAAEWSSKGINVNCFSPAFTESPLTSGPEIQESLQKYLATVPQARTGNVEDLMGAVIYLASPLSNYANGLNLIVDGGYTLY